MYQLEIDPGNMSLVQLRAVVAQPVQLSLNNASHQAINASSAAVTRVIEQGRVVYGINTGFGLLANTLIELLVIQPLLFAAALLQAFAGLSGGNNVG